MITKKVKEKLFKQSACDIITQAELTYKKDISKHYTKIVSELKERFSDNFIEVPELRISNTQFFSIVKKYTKKASK